MEENYFRIKEAADYLKISKSTFWRLRKNNDIKTAIVNGTPLFRKVDLDDFVDNLVEGKRK